MDNFLISIVIDFANYKKKNANANSGYLGFLCCVEQVSQKLWAVPMKKKELKEFQRAVVEALEHYDGIKYIVSGMANTEKTITPLDGN